MTVKQFILECAPYRLYRTYEYYAFWRNYKREFKNWIHLFFSQAYPSWTTHKIGSIQSKVPIVEAKWADGRRLIIPSLNSQLAVFTRRHLEELGINFSGKTCIDIGAHVGTVALEMAWQGAKVFAYEPDPNNFKILTENCRLNQLQNVECFQMAVGESRSRKTFFIGPSSTSGALVGAATSVVPRNSEDEITVDAITLKDIFSDHQLDSVELLKMDCEGGEYEILLNASAETLAKIQNLLIEIHPVENSDRIDLILHLKSNGFRYRELRWGTGGCVDAIFSRATVSGLVA